MCKKKSRAPDRSIYIWFIFYRLLGTSKQINFRKEKTRLAEISNILKRYATEETVSF